MNSQTAPAAQNLLIGNGKTVHALTDLGLPNHPLCGRIRTNGRGQYVRRTSAPVTCKGCLAKAAQAAPAEEAYADKFERTFDL